MQEQNIKEWLVRLKGANYDLAELPSVFNFPEATVIRLDEISKSSKRGQANNTF